jgi:hypothetical protein
MPKNAEVVKIVASLEGMRVVIDGERCKLHEYNFAANEWCELESSSWPMMREQAESWLRGWNIVDHSAALSHLMGLQSQ